MLFPLMNFMAFAGGLSRLRHVPGFDFHGGYTAFQFVFVLLQSAAFGGVFTGFGIARDFELGFANRYLLAATDRRGIVAGYALAALVRALVTWTILTTVALLAAPNRSGIVLGYTAAALGRWLVTASFLTVIAFAAGMHVGGNGVDLFGLYTLAAILNLAAVLWAAGVAMRFRTMQAGPIMQLPVFLILFFAPVYVPLSLLEGWIHAVATANPVTRVLESGRGFVAGEPTEVGIAYGAALALAVAFSIWAWRGLRKAEAAG